LNELILAASTPIRVICFDSMRSLDAILAKS
jgi:hypothetical protein